MTISRSRKHITNYYGTEEIGTFPDKLEPDTHTPRVDIKREYIQIRCRKNKNKMRRTTF